MPTLEALERAIATSRKLKEIVRTMKVLAATSIRQYAQVVAAVADYGRTIELGLKAVLRDSFPTMAYRDGGRAAIVFGSDHGLCGRFNEAVLDFAGERIGGRQVRLLAVGARIDLGFQARGLRAEESFFSPGSVAGMTSTVRKILEKVEDWQSEGVEIVDLFHHRYCERGHSQYQLVEQRLLPPLDHFSRLAREVWPGRSLPTFTMEADALLAALLRQYLFIGLYRALAESQAAEHSQRLVTMQLAEKNIGERLEELTVTYQQLRQEQITAELLEVVSGFEAVRSEEGVKSVLARVF